MKKAIVTLNFLSFIYLNLFITTVLLKEILINGLFHPLSWNYWETNFRFKTSYLLPQLITFSMNISVFLKLTNSLAPKEMPLTMTSFQRDVMKLIHPLLKKLWKKLVKVWSSLCKNPQKKINSNSFSLSFPGRTAKLTNWWLIENFWLTALSWIEKSIFTTSPSSTDLIELNFILN